MRIEIIRIILFLGLLLFVISIAYIIYKVFSKKIGKERKIAEILMKTEEGRIFLTEQENKYKLLAKKMWLPLVVLFFTMVIISISGTIIEIKNFYERGFENFELEDLKLLVFPGMAIYFTIIIFGFVKNYKTKNGA